MHYYNPITHTTANVIHFDSTTDNVAYESKGKTHIVPYPLFISEFSSLWNVDYNPIHLLLKEHPLAKRTYTPFMGHVFYADRHSYSRKV